MGRAGWIVLGCVAFIGLTIAGMIYSMGRFEAEKPLLSSAAWAGEWNSVTCHAGESFAWTVTFQEGPTGLVATYKGSAAPVTEITGKLTGDMRDMLFIGTWTQDQDPANTGRITLELFDGKAFAGTYENEATGETNRWLGRRESVPEC